MENDDCPTMTNFHFTMSDDWYEEEFKRQHHYRELKVKKCCSSCKHCFDSYDCYINIALDRYPYKPFPVAPFAVCDKYEPEEEAK